VSAAKGRAPTITDRAYQQLVESHTFVVLDTETCDADDGRHAIQIATTTIKRGRVAGRWSALVNPGVPITNTKYHHLNDDLVADAPAFAEVVADLEAQLAGDDVDFVAHNASHDVSTLRREYERLGGDIVELPVIDTMYLPAVVGHQAEDRRLPTLLASFGLENAKHHDAAADADATAQLLLALLKVAASNGFSDLDRLRLDGGVRTTLSWAKASATRGGRPGRQAPLIDAHAATHALTLGPSPTSAELEAWVEVALECARLRCDMLLERAEDAMGCAAELHARLTKRLKSFATSAEPGQGATLVSALSALAPAALEIRGVRPWWTKNRPLIMQMPRCTFDEACPDCDVGLPCPLDIAHQPLAAITCDLADGKVPTSRRAHMFTAGSPPLIISYCQARLYDLAGYVAWLVADSFEAENNGARALKVIDTALQHGATDPRLTMAQGRRMAAHRQDKRLRQIVEDALAHRNTDPGWDDLADWYTLYRGQQARRVHTPGPKPGVSTRVARPAGRVRPQRFSY
jgi:DNA polymerase III epsilon subunit family exonuclease